MLEQIDRDIATVEAELTEAEMWVANAMKREAQRKTLSSYKRLSDVFNDPDPSLVKQVVEALDLVVEFNPDTRRAKVHARLPLDYGLETIMSDTTCTPPARRWPPRPRRCGTGARGAWTSSSSHGRFATGAREGVGKRSRGPRRFACAAVRQVDSEHRRRRRLW